MTLAKETAELAVEQILPPRGNVLAIQGIPENAVLDSRVEALTERSYTLFCKLARPVAITAPITPQEFARVYEGEGSKSEKAFYELLSKAKGAGPVVSVEDQRELKYRPEESQTAEEHNEETKEKKGFFARLFSIFR